MPVINDNYLLDGDFAVVDAKQQQRFSGPGRRKCRCGLLGRMVPRKTIKHFSRSRSKVIPAFDGDAVLNWRCGLTQNE